MSICKKYKLDIRCKKDIDEGFICEGCISCVYSGMNGCMRSSRGHDLGDGKTYISDSGKSYSFEDEENIG